MLGKTEEEGKGRGEEGMGGEGDRISLEKSELINLVRFNSIVTLKGLV